jgi:hypothetical protein
MKLMKHFKRGATYKILGTSGLYSGATKEVITLKNILCGSLLHCYVCTLFTLCCAYRAGFRGGPAGELPRMPTCKRC